MNAIIKRELLDVFRTRKALVLQILLAVVFALLVLLRWPSESQVDLSGDAAKEVFRLFGYGLLTLIVLVAPAFPATSIVREVKKGTLVLLFNSPTPPWKIYLGKLIGVSGFLLLVLIMSLPSAMACLSLGGISLREELIPLYAVLGFLTVHYAILGLWVSSRSASPDGALRATYLLLLALAVLSLIPHLLFQGRNDLPDQASWLLKHVSPIPAVMEILGHGYVGTQGIESHSRASSTELFFLLAGFVTLALLVDTLYRFNHRLFDRPRAAGTMTDDMQTTTQVARGVYFLFFFDPRKRKSGIPPLVNPVLVKEFRTRKFGRSHWLMRIIAFCAIGSLILAYLSTRESVSWGPEVIGGIMVMLQAGLIVLFTPSLASGLISGEIESGGWQLLQMTPLPARRIVTGKLLSVIWTMAIVLCATLPGYLVMGWIVPERWNQVFDVTVCLVWAALFSVFVSAAISSLFHKSSAATVTAYAVLSSLYIGTFFFWLFRDAPFGHDLVQAVLTLNPIAAALRVVETPGFVDYQIVRNNWWLMGSGCIVSLTVLVVQTWRLSRPQ